MTKLNNNTYASSFSAASSTPSDFMRDTFNNFWAPAELYVLAQWYWNQPLMPLFLRVPILFSYLVGFLPKNIESVISFVRLSLIQSLLKNSTFL